MHRYTCIDMHRYAVHKHTQCIHQTDPHMCTYTSMRRCSDGHAAIHAKCRGLRRIEIATHREETIMPYLIGSSHPVVSPDGQYMYLASAANDFLTFSAISDAYFKMREVKSVPAGMYRVELATGDIKFIAPMSIELQTASAVIITSDAKTLYYNDDHAVFGMHVETGAAFLLCGSRETFGKANGKGEDARSVFDMSLVCA
jgi:hypothetical protein